MFGTFARSALRSGARRFSIKPEGGGSSNVGPFGLLVGLAAAAGVAFQANQSNEQDGKVAALQAQVNSLEIALAGKTNSAFVFIKPHACKGKPGKVEALVEDSFKKAGIRVTGSGSISAEEIDKNMLIDTHCASALSAVARSRAVIYG